MIGVTSRMEQIPPTNFWIPTDVMNVGDVIPEITSAAAASKLQHVQPQPIAPPATRRRLPVSIQQVLQVQLGYFDRPLIVLRNVSTSAVFTTPCSASMNVEMLMPALPPRDCSLAWNSSKTPCRA